MPEEENEFDDIDQSNDYLDSDKEEKLELEEDTAKEEEPKEEEKEEYGSKVQKRINKEVSKRKLLEDENRSLNDRLSNLENQVNHSSQTNADADLDARATALKAKRQEMYDVGDIDPKVEDDWQDVRHEQRQSAERKAYNEQQQAQQPAQQQRQIPKAQQDWMQENSDWYGVDKERTDNANSTFQAILDDGYSEAHEGAYKEFDKRLTPTESKREQAPPTAAPSGNGGAPTNKGKLTQDDFVMMREMGMDPHNIEHRKQLISNKRRAA